MNFYSSIKKSYYPPELEFIIYDLDDTLIVSQPTTGGDWKDIDLWEDDYFSDGDDVNIDHNNIGNGDDFSGDDSDSDVNNDYYDIGDGEDFIN